MFTIAVLFLGFVCFVIRAGRVSTAVKGFVVGLHVLVFLVQGPPKMVQLDQKDHVFKLFTV